MLLRGGSMPALCLSILSFMFTPAIAGRQEVAPRADPRSVGRPLTCDRRIINRDSYEMATIGQARTLLTDRRDFLDAFRINKHLQTLHYLNVDVRELAERALEADPRNMMAQSILARQYTIAGWDRPAIDAWTRVMESGGAIVWTATLYDVDDKSFFLMSFGRDAVRIYRMGQFTGPIDRKLGYAQFPQPTESAFYEATAGCPDPSVRPMATILWKNVQELRSGNWVLWLELARPVTLISDRDRKKTLRELKVNLHGATGEVRILAEPNDDYDPRRDAESEAWKNVRGIGLGPWEYNRRVRDMILRFADPQDHIRRSSAGRGAGW